MSSAIYSLPCKVASLCLVSSFGLWLPVEFFGTGIGLQHFNSGFVCSYISWFDSVLKDWIYCWWSVHSLGIGRVLIVSFDSILKNSLGLLMVSCHDGRFPMGGCRGWWAVGLLEWWSASKIVKDVSVHFLFLSINYHIAGHIQFLII